MMTVTSPVYTTENECQDCYKCVRHCPVKAIRIVNGKASVIPEACVACGECVKVCPAHAKKIRSDLARLKELVASGAKLYASVAPSFAGYFKGVTIGQIAAALKAAGFAGASETAHGAEAVSAHVSKLLDETDSPLVISSACPAAVDMVRKYLPAYAKFISPLPSPVRAHCRLIREKYGQDAKVVFFGPCAAKKNESDSHPDELALAVIFPALEQFLAERGITFGKEAELALGPAEEGRFYSVEGGMNDTLRDGRTDVRYVSVSGLEDFRRMLEDFDPAEFGLHPENFQRKLFVEVLACPGGCVNGPAMPRGASGLATLFATDATAPIRASSSRCFAHCGTSAYPAAAVVEDEPDEAAIAGALARVGKTAKADEINCGACGYNSCREFAKALLAGKAEEAMCHIYFAEMAGALGEYDALGNLDGLGVDGFMPEFAELFTGAVEHGSEIVKYRQQWSGRIVTISVFPISVGKFAGAVVQDVTKNEGRREEIAAKARDVIRKNVYTVQQVARLFGEHIAETEIMLNEIAGAYESQTVGKRLREGGSEEYLNG